MGKVSFIELKWVVDLSLRRLEGILHHNCFNLAVFHVRYSSRRVSFISVSGFSEAVWICSRQNSVMKHWSNVFFIRVSGTPKKGFDVKRVRMEQDTGWHKNLWDRNEMSHFLTSLNWENVCWARTPVLAWTGLPPPLLTELSWSFAFDLLCSPFNKNYMFPPWKSWRLENRN